MAFVFTGDNVKETPTFKTPPVGDYNVLIKSAEEKISKAGKNMIALTMEIQHPEYKNLLFDYIVDNEYAQQRIYDILTSCQVALTKGMAVTPNLFVGKVGKVKIKHEEYNGETQIRVNYWKKAEAPASSPVPAPASKYSADNRNPDGIPF